MSLQTTLGITHVVCDNCSAAAPTWSTAITAAGLLIGAISLAFVAWTMAKRAALTVIPSVVNERSEAPPKNLGPGRVGISRPTGGLDFVLSIGIENKGGRARGKSASDVLVNVVAPENLAEFYWSDYRGGPRRDREQVPVPTSETLDDADGRAEECAFLSHMHQRIAQRHSYVSYIRVRAKDGATSVPFRIRVDSPDLAGSERIVDFTVEILLD